MVLLRDLAPTSASRAGTVARLSSRSVVIQSTGFLGREEDLLEDSMEFNGATLWNWRGRLSLYGVTDRDELQQQFE
jgi:hypothetical protein